MLGSETFLKLIKDHYFIKKKRKRSQVQGSTFRVKDKGKIKDPMVSQQILVLPLNCEGSARFQIGDDKANVSFIKRFQNGLQEPNETLNPDYIGKPLNPEPLNGYQCI